MKLAEHDFNEIPDGYVFREGDHSDLIQFGNNRRYTHHPVAASAECLEMKVFRHLNAEEIIYIIRKYAGTRSMVNFFDRMLQDNRTSYEYVRGIQVNLENAIEMVGLRGGCSCETCDKMAYNPVPDVAGNWEEVDAFFQRDRSDAAIGRLCYPKFHGRLPILCDDCMSIVRQVQIENPHLPVWRNGDVLALKQLLRLVEVAAGIPPEKRKRKKRAPEPRNLAEVFWSKGIGT